MSSLQMGKCQMGKQQNVKLSIVTIDRGRLSEAGGWSLETLRIGHLMRAAGYVEGLKIENATGRLPWFGSLPEVERRIKHCNRNAMLRRRSSTACCSTTGAGSPPRSVGSLDRVAPRRRTC